MSKTLQEITDKFVSKSSYLEQGAGKLSKLWGCSKSDVYKAREAAREILHSTEKTHLQTIISQQEDELARYIGSEKTQDGEIRKYESVKPLSPQEIETLAGVDNIATYVARVWDKLGTNGIWTYSIDIRYRIKDFYNSEELKEKFKQLFPDLKPVKVLGGLKASGKALVILLADDHAGAVNVNYMFDSQPYTGEVYADRLLKIVDEVVKLAAATRFEEVHVVGLGDQLNGWNAQTTRGGHEVKSLPNKDQFDIYVEGKRKFYDALFISGVGVEYFVHDIENSNHSGLGLSYMANRALEIYLEARFPEVSRESILDPISGFDYGVHCILIGHGKDEKVQKRPLPYNLNDKTDLLLYDYSQNKGYSPYSHNITFYKGDLHSYGIQLGRFGRYINVPSIIGNMDYSDINFGNSRAGALLEIFSKDSNTIQSQPVWFK